MSKFGGTSFDSFLTKFERISYHSPVSEFSHDTTTNIRGSRGLVRILEGAGWSDSPDCACESQGAHRDNASVEAEPHPANASTFVEKCR
jgi:hypothetical protein